MGLDNIPNEYGCKAKGTAVLVPLTDSDGKAIIDEYGNPEVQIDCKATQEAGGCPWSKVFGERQGRVYGMFGTDCWYRGKYGFALLNAFGLEGEILYGDESQIVSAEDCHELADEMVSAFTTADGERKMEIMWEGENVAQDWWYLADYLRWSAIVCNGLNAWY